MCLLLFAPLALVCPTSAFCYEWMEIDLITEHVRYCAGIADC